MGQDNLGTSNKPTQIARLLQGNVAATATVGGIAQTGDLLSLTVLDRGMPNGQGQAVVTYTVQVNDNLTSIAAGIAAAVNANTNLQAIFVTATAVGSVVHLASNSTNATTYNSAVSSGALETFVITQNANLAEQANLAGTATPGDTLTITVIDAALPSGSQPTSPTASKPVTA